MHTYALVHIVMAVLRHFECVIMRNNSCGKRKTKGRYYIYFFQHEHLNEPPLLNIPKKGFRTVDNLQYSILFAKKFYLKEINLTTFQILFKVGNIQQLI